MLGPEGPDSRVRIWPIRTLSFLNNVFIMRLGRIQAQIHSNVHPSQVAARRMPRDLDAP
eukprot:SAG22_NODE_21222_length_259_cov_0.625000_1_plen_58_part_10